MKYLSMLLLGILLFLSACNQTQTKLDSLTRHNLFDEVIQKPEKWSEIVDSSFTIALETNIDGLISKITKVQADDSLIVILDKGNLSRIMLFGLDGRFIQQLAKTGKGPGEYVYPVDFNIVPQRKEIWVLEGPSRKILKYGYSGRFLGAVKLSVNSSIRHFSVLSTGGLVCEAGNDSLLCITDPNGQMLFSAIPKSEKMGLERPFDNFKSQVRYHVYLDDSIYLLNQDACIPDRILKFSDQDESDTRAKLSHYSESQDYIELYYNQDGASFQRWFVSLINKVNNNIESYEITMMKKDITGFHFRLTGEKYNEFRIGYGQTPEKTEDGENPQILFYRYSLK